ncbi:MAG: zinc-binding alcohol dehydrogenase [Chloroflexi bacterium]|nr:zinc-binding alcohol dehydrogenase [Chloroflexota bacterium]
MKASALFFVEPYKVEIRTLDVEALGDGEVLIRSRLSAISSGTELLLYRGQTPRDMVVDSVIPSLPGELNYPHQYGYSTVGQVEDIGNGVDEDWLGRRVFSFHPHQSLFKSHVDHVIAVPDGLSDEEATFLPNMETAVNLLHDGNPLLGERIAIFGQGIVGLLTTALLARIPLARLITLDRFELRRSASRKFGAEYSFDPEINDLSATLSQNFGAPDNDGSADLIYELSGNPKALDQAISASGFHTRIVIGSWYGVKETTLDLGRSFHRNRIRIISSQVSTIRPELSGRWKKKRRLNFALQMIETIRPAELITHRFSLESAAQAFALLDKQAAKTIQVLLRYES